MAFVIASACFCVQASRVRDSMAKSLYGALFDWIIVHVNHAMFNRRDMEESVSVSSRICKDLPGEVKQAAAPTVQQTFHIFKPNDWTKPADVMLNRFRNLLFVVFSVCPSVSWTCLDLRTSRKTPLSSCASTTATRNYNTTSISTSLGLNKWVCFIIFKSVFKAFQFPFS